MRSRRSNGVVLASLAMLAGCASDAPRPDTVATSSAPDDTPRLLVPDPDPPPRGASELAPSAEMPAPPRVTAVIDAKSWTWAGRKGVAMTTPNYRVHTTLAPSVLRDRAPAFMEHALMQYTSALGELPEPRGVMTTYIMSNREQWRTITRQVTGPRSDLYLAIPRGGFAVDGTAVYWDIGSHDTLQIAAHEGWHQYTQATFKHALPIWLEEGIAAYMEGFRWHPSLRNTPVFFPWANTERYDHLRRIVAAGELQPLDELLISRPQDLVTEAGDGTLTWYAQVWALTHFLAEGEGGRYADGLTALLRDAAGGTLYQTVASRLDLRASQVLRLTRRGDAVREVYFDEDADAFEAAYRSFVSDIVRVGARDAIVAGRSPVSASSVPGEGSTPR